MPAPVSAAVEGRLELAEGAVRPEDGRGGEGSARSGDRALELEGGAGTFTRGRAPLARTGPALASDPALCLRSEMLAAGGSFLLRLALLL